MSEFDVVLAAVRLAVGALLLWRIPRLAATGAPAGREPVSVIVPARDEAASIGHLLASLGSAGLTAADEVVVVDDQSRDDTATLARRAGARVVSGEPPPAGWTGKSWACQQGVASGAAEVIVFVDADVRFGPGGLDAVRSRLGDVGGLVSVQPHHDPGRPVEHLALAANVTGFMATGAAMPAPSLRRGAFGPVLACRRAEYEAVGGHAVVRAEIVEDIALAERFRAAGRPVDVSAGGDLVRFRMYPGGLPAILEGFSKNLVAGVRSVHPVLALAVAAWMTVVVQAALAPVALAVGVDPAFVAVLYAAVALQLHGMARRLGSFSPLIALVFPLPVAVFLAAFVRSVWWRVRGRVRWKGREIRTRPTRAR